MAHAKDEFYMRLALGVAKDGIGLIGSRPSVGCVIVYKGKIIACERTQDEIMHAEYKAAETAFESFDDITGCEIYLTLEPMIEMAAEDAPDAIPNSVSNSVPNSVDVLIDLKPARIIISMPRPNDGGIEKLKEAGIEIETDLLTPEAAALYSAL